MSTDPPGPVTGTATERAARHPVFCGPLTPSSKDRRNPELAAAPDGAVNRSSNTVVGAPADGRTVSVAGAPADRERLAVLLDPVVPHALTSTVTAAAAAIHIRRESALRLIAGASLTAATGRRVRPWR
jgi:hypothetical protein